MQSPITDSVVLITGASAGIGAELARVVAPRAKAVILLARREDRLTALAQELSGARAEILTVSCDLRNLADIDAALSRISGRFPHIDVLINNAGLGDFTLFRDSNWERVDNMLETNVRALVYLTRKLLPSMLERGRGGVLNVSSGMGMETLPGFSVYVGTKHFVTGFTESLRLETLGSGVVVSQVCPGPVETEFAQVSRSPIEELPGFLRLSARACAEQSIAGFERGKAIIVPGALMRVIMAVGQATPRFVRRGLYGLGAKRVKRLASANK
jgi:hypothetical protein